MLVIDGSMGEGGGQVLRSALALSLVTRIPFRIERIRARRKRPGLMRQHLAAVRAAAEIGGARARGADLGSQTLEFLPGAARGGSYRFDVGSAGSATLVLQTLLPALWGSGRTSALHLQGGTHNPFAPPFDALERAFLPLLARMGVRTTARLLRPGFYPSGGGKLDVAIEPVENPRALDLRSRGAIRSVRACAFVAGLPRAIAARELAVVRRELDWSEDDLEIAELPRDVGPGNVIHLEIASDSVTEVFTGFGRRGVPAEEVALGAVEEARSYLAAGVPVGTHLADQLLLPMALCGGGAFVTLPLSSHTTTNLDVLRRFLELEVTTRALGPQAWLLEMRCAPFSAER